MSGRARASDYRLTVVVLVLGVATFSLVQSAVSPILPLIQHDLHTSERTVTWVLTGYLLSAAVFTPILGRIGDMFGKERVFVAVLLVFAVGSGISALAANIDVMIAGRIVQGVGGALVPLGFGIVRDEVPQERVAAAIGLIAALLGVGGGLGTAVAGPIADTLGYHWLFWLPMIILVLSAAAAFVLLPQSAVRTPGRVNWTGAVLLSAWLIALLLAFSEAPAWGWLSPRFIGLVVAAIVLGAAWMASELRSVNPLIDMKMMRLPTVWRVNLVSLLYGVTLYGSFAFLPQFAQSPTSTGYGYAASVTESGLIVLPSAVTAFLAGTIAARLTRQYGPRPIVFAGSGIGIFPYLLLALPVHHVSLLYIASACLGASFGLAYSTMSNIIVAAVPPEQTGVANGMNANIRTIGGAIGAAVVASVITAQVGPTGYPASSGYTAGWIVLAAVATVATVLTLTFPKQVRPRPVEITPAEALGPVSPVSPVGTVSTVELDGVA